MSTRPNLEVARLHVPTSSHGIGCTLALAERNPLQLVALLVIECIERQTVSDEEVVHPAYMAGKLTDEEFAAWDNAGVAGELGAKARGT
jgi:hypothetical protein